jgi:uncharacterized damage-inducible protein DinB
MRSIDLLVAEFDRESGVTRALLERFPADRAAWRPHVKSMTLGALALHLATLPAWVGMTLRQSELDLNPPGGQGYRPPDWESPAAALALFESNVAAARAVLVNTAEAELEAPWTLKNGGHTLFTMPRVGVLRTFVFNHIVHHRGQLSVYLRLCDVPLPSMYGPTADVPIDSRKAVDRRDLGAAD